VNATIIGGGGRGAFGGNNQGSTQSGGQGAAGIVIARYRGTSAGTGGTITAGTGTADGYTLHTFTASGASALDLSSLNLNTRLGAVENGVISGSGDLTFTGPGTLTLNASNIYTGTTRVNAGTLALGNAGSIATSAGIHIAQGARFDVSGLSGGFSLGASQTLAGSGTVAGNTTIASGGTLAPGNSPGVLTIEGATNFNSGSMFEWELDTAQSNPETNRGIAYDGVNTTSVSGSGAIFKILLTGTQDFTDGFWDQERIWMDIFKSADGSSNLTGWAAVFSGGFQYAYNGKTVAPNSSGYFALSGDSLIWSAVPEPGHALALAGLLAASALLRRRA
jgi:autotransporter-associated beta strand protein